MLNDKIFFSCNSAFRFPENGILIFHTSSTRICFSSVKCGMSMLPLHSVLRNKKATWKIVMAAAGLERMPEEQAVYKLRDIFWAAQSHQEGLEKALLEAQEEFFAPLRSGYPFPHIEEWLAKNPEEFPEIRSSMTAWLWTQHWFSYTQGTLLGYFVKLIIHMKGKTPSDFLIQVAGGISDDSYKAVRSVVDSYSGETKVFRLLDESRWKAVGKGAGGTPYVARGGKIELIKL